MILKLQCPTCNSDSHVNRCHDDRIPVRLEWGGKVLTEDVAWFQYESDTTLNSNVYEIAQTLVLTHFPGGSNTSQAGQTLPRWVKHFPGGSNTSQVGQTLPRWVKHFPGGSNTSQVGQTLPRWVKHFPGGSNTSQVGQTLPRWVKHFPGGSNTSLVGRHYHFSSYCFLCPLPQLSVVVDGGRFSRRQRQPNLCRIS